MAEQETIRVLAQDGQYFGRLEHVAADPQTGKPTGLVIERNGNEVLVPLRYVQRSDGKTVTLQGPGENYDDLQMFNRRAYRLLDRELEHQETKEWLESMGIEDFQIGEDEEFAEKADKVLEEGRDVHTGAENPYRTELKKNGNGRSGIASDPTDMNRPGESSEEMAERTRSDMH